MSIHRGIGSNFEVGGGAEIGLTLKTCSHCKLNKNALLSKSLKLKWLAFSSKSGGASQTPCCYPHEIH